MHGLCHCLAKVVKVCVFHSPLLPECRGFGCLRGGAGHKWGEMGVPALYMKGSYSHPALDCLQWARNFSCGESVSLWGWFATAVNIVLFHVLLKEWHGNVFSEVLHCLLGSSHDISQDASNSTGPNLNLWFPQQPNWSCALYLSEWYNHLPILDASFSTPSVSNPPSTHVRFAL